MHSQLWRSPLARDDISLIDGAWQSSTRAKEPIRLLDHEGSFGFPSKLTLLSAITEYTMILSAIVQESRETAVNA